MCEVSGSRYGIPAFDMDTHMMQGNCMIIEAAFGKGVSKFNLSGKPLANIQTNKCLFYHSLRALICKAFGIEEKTFLNIVCTQINDSLVPNLAMGWYARAKQLR
jgi:hypothetical protein